MKKILYLDSTNDFFGRKVAQGFIQASQLHSWWNTCLYPFSNTPASELADLFDQMDGLVENETDNPLTHVNDQAISELAKIEIDRLNLYHTAFIGYKDVPWSEKRGVNFLKGNKSIAYLELEEEEQVSLSGIRSIQTWLETLKKPVGIFAATDLLGVATLLACELSNLKVPDEVSVIAVDNNLLRCNSTSPALSSIDLYPEQIGERAAYLLAQKLDLLEEDAKLPPQPQPSLVIRQSSHNITPYMINYKKALEWIEQHALSGPNVEQVAAACNCSRRALERAFAHHSKLTPSAAIRKHRMAAIKTILASKDLPIVHVASQAHFPDASTFINFVKRQTGKSPTQIRESL